MIMISIISIVFFENRIVYFNFPTTLVLFQVHVHLSKQTFLRCTNDFAVWEHGNAIKRPRKKLLFLNSMAINRVKLKLPITE